MGVNLLLRMKNGRISRRGNFLIVREISRELDSWRKEEGMLPVVGMGKFGI